MAVSNDVATTLDFAIECSRTSHDELVFRAKHRDDWLKVQLFTQMALLALARGVEIGGVKSVSALPDVLVVAAPASVVLAALYASEDLLVGLLSRYRSRLSVSVAKAHGKADTGLFEASAEIGEYAKRALPLRFTAQVVGFVLIPAVSVSFRMLDPGRWFLVEGALNVVLLGVALWMVGSAARFQRTRALSAAEGASRPTKDGVPPVALHQRRAALSQKKGGAKPPPEESY